VTIGVLALQGDVREHLAALDELGVAGRPVRSASDLVGVEGVILPGGESTTLSLLLQSSGLFDPLAEMIGSGLPTFGTCAGLVLLAREVRGGRPDQRGFGVIDCAVQRNGYGRQSESFETTVEVTDDLGDAGQPMPAVFIRAPLIEEVGGQVEVLGWAAAPGHPNRRPVILRAGRAIATAFHPELTSDRRVHRLFLAVVEGSDVVHGGESEVTAATR
jgi:pyridoxal 5'-phosphate synthase pdxT subunit